MKAPIPITEKRFRDPNPATERNYDALREVGDRRNSGAAALNRDLFVRSGVFVVSLFGDRGCGKTSLVEATLRRGAGGLRIGVIIGHIRALEDAERLKGLSPQVHPIETIDLSASLIHESLACIDLSQLHVLIIERAGSAANARHGYDDLGQAAKVGMFCINHGKDGIERYSQRAQECDLVLLTKMDLLPCGAFDMDSFRNFARRRNPGALMIDVSVFAQQGVAEWCDWLRRADPQPLGDLCSRESL